MHYLSDRRQLKIEALALGTGPSFWEFIEGPIPFAFRYGCSTIPAHLKLDVYCYGDAVHEPDLPMDRTEIVATPRCWNAGMTPFGDFPHGGSGGGMAISVACHRHQTVALVGFDGFPDDGPDGFCRNWMHANRELIRFWQRRGKRVISLMPKSFLDDLVEQAWPHWPRDAPPDVIAGWHPPTHEEVAGSTKVEVVTTFGER